MYAVHAHTAPPLSLSYSLSHTHTLTVSLSLAVTYGISSPSGHRFVQVSLQKSALRLGEDLVGWCDFAHATGVCYKARAHLSLSLPVSLSLSLSVPISSLSILMLPPTSLQIGVVLECVEAIASVYASDGQTREHVAQPLAHAHMHTRDIAFTSFSLPIPLSIAPSFSTDMGQLTFSPH